MTEPSGPTLRPAPEDRSSALDGNIDQTPDTVRLTVHRPGKPERTLRGWLAPGRGRAVPLPPNQPEPQTRQMGYREAGRQYRGKVSMTPGDDMLSSIPDSDVTTFRADAYRRLEPAEFAPVDAVYKAAVEATCRWLNAQTGSPCRHDPERRAAPVWFGRAETVLAERIRAVLRPRPGARRGSLGNTAPGGIDEWLDTLGLYRFLGGFVADSPRRGHTIVRLRGAQAAFLLHGMRLELPPDLNYAVGPGMTTVVVADHTVEWIRDRAGDPVAAAALATVLCSGATMVELGSVPRTAVNGDALVFTGPIGYSQPADMYVWVVPPSVRDLLHEADRYQESRPDPSPKLFAGAVGSAGRTLRETAARCEVALPEQHPWHRSWIRQAGLLRGLDQPEYVRNTDLLFGLGLVARPGPFRDV